jgi:hypothetical protein
MKMDELHQSSTIHKLHLLLIYQSVRQQGHLSYTAKMPLLAL